MPVWKTEAAPDREDTISLTEIRQVLSELECLGFVERTGEFANGHPVYVPTAAGREACLWPPQSMREIGLRLSRTGTRARRLTD